MEIVYNMRYIIDVESEGYVRQTRLGYGRMQTTSNSDLASLITPPMTRAHAHDTV